VLTAQEEVCMPPDKDEHDREGETSKPPGDEQGTDGPVDGPGKSGAGEQDLGETSQGEPGN
jgi:hypothetical protein